MTSFLPDPSEETNYMSHEVNNDGTSPRNPDHDGLNYILEGSAAEEDIARRLPDTPAADIELVGPCIWWQYNMSGCKDEDPRAVIAFADIESSSTLNVRSGSGSDLQTECRTERTVHFSSCI